MIKPEILVNPNIDQAIVSTLSVNTNDAVGVHFVTDNGLRRGLRCVWDDFCVSAITARLSNLNTIVLVQHRDLFCRKCAGTEVGLIGLKFTLKKVLIITKLEHSATNKFEDVGSSSNLQSGKLRRIPSSRIDSKEAYKSSNLASLIMGL